MEICFVDLHELHERNNKTNAICPDQSHPHNGGSLKVLAHKTSWSIHDSYTSALGISPERLDRHDVQHKFRTFTLPAFWESAISDKYARDVECIADPLSHIYSDLKFGIVPVQNRTLDFSRI
jgi:hypothetical protein